MRIVPLSTVRVLLATTRRQRQRGWGSGFGIHPTPPVQVSYSGWVGSHSAGHTHPYFGIPPTYPPLWDTHPFPRNRMTDTCKNITFPQLRWQAIINRSTHAGSTVSFEHIHDIYKKTLNNLFYFSAFSNTVVYFPDFWMQ